MIRLLIVDPDAQRQAQLTSTIRTIQQLDVVGTASDRFSAMPFAKSCSMALVSAQLPDQSALELTRALSGSDAKQVIVLGLADSSPQVIPFIEAGAVGFVPPDASHDQVVDAIFAAQRGEAHVSAELGAALVARMNELAQLSRWSNLERVDRTEIQLKLTSRERQVLALMAKGKSNQDIALELVIEHGTVKNHVHSILKKLNLRSRAEAARYFALLNANA